MQSPQEDSKTRTYVSAAAVSNTDLKRALLAILNFYKIPVSGGRFCVPVWCEVEDSNFTKGKWRSQRLEIHQQTSLKFGLPEDFHHKFTFQTEALVEDLYFILQASLRADWLTKHLTVVNPVDKNCTSPASNALGMASSPIIDQEDNHSTANRLGNALSTRPLSLEQSSFLTLRPLYNAMSNARPACQTGNQLLSEILRRSLVLWYATQSRNGIASAQFGI
ncbi:hypothetical protein MP228_004542 [Amoeboaphelidium protococcarum]|nr:hypothetical protein MP228_004542 [Amoeboaphelidium protococcarum]